MRRRHRLTGRTGFEGPLGSPAFEDAESNAKLGDFPFEAKALRFSSQGLVLGELPGLALQDIDKLAHKESNERLIVTDLLRSGAMLGHPEISQ